MDMNFHQERTDWLTRSPFCVTVSLQLLEDVLNEDAYLADVAGLHYHLSLEGLAGIEVRGGAQGCVGKEGARKNGCWVRRWLSAATEGRWVSVRSCGRVQGECP